MGLDGQRGSRALTQILFIAGVIVAVGAIFVLAGILLSDGGGKGVAWTILGGLAVLVVILAAVRRRRTVSLEESLPTRTRES